MEFPVTVQGVDIYWLGHSSVKLVDPDDFTVYIDPWSDIMREELEDEADLIIATHDHDDHFDVKAIQQLRKRDTIVVCAKDSEEDVPENASHDVLRPNRRVKSHHIEVRGIHAYNVRRFRSPDVPYHPKGDGFGALFELNGVKFYHAGDTDLIPEMEELEEEDIDVAFLPVGGTYTMDQEEAIDAINTIKPEKVVPIHYDYLDKTSCDIDKFESDIETRTEAEPLILEKQSP